MRQGSNARRARGRPHRRQNGGINKNANFDSNGPEGRVRGNANQVYEKYINLARDATSAGDRILAESFYQFAEHYYRIVNDSMDPGGNRDRRQEGEDGGRDDDNNQRDASDDDRDSQGQGGRQRRGRMNGRQRGDGGDDNGGGGGRDQRSNQGGDAEASGNEEPSGGASRQDEQKGEANDAPSQLPGLGEQPSLADAIDKNDKEEPKPRRRGRPRKNQDQDGGPVSA